MSVLRRFRPRIVDTIVAIWATIWATYDTARLVRAARDGPAGLRGVALDALAGLVRSAFLRPRRWRDGGALDVWRVGLSKSEIGLVCRCRDAGACADDGPWRYLNLTRLHGP